MIFEFRCLKCNHVNSWTIDTVNISEYACKECHVPIGYSNGKVIKLYEKVAMSDPSRSRVYEEQPVYGFGHIEPRTIYYTTSSNATDSTTGYWYQSTQSGRTW